MAAMITHWQPTACLENLRQRALLLQKVRHFFEQRHYLEVETPVLSRYTVTDPHLSSFATTCFGQDFFLQTSPEYHMKRLLAAGSGPIFQITKAFRKDETGSRHNPEFTLLEWYHPGYDLHALMDEVNEFLCMILQTPPAERFSYQAIFQKILGINPLTADITTLKQYAPENTLDDMADRDTWLDLLMSHCIEPQLGQEKPVFIYDYPASQAALSIIRGDVGERVEVYYKGIELANGFHELTDPIEQKKRFEANIKQRQQENLPLLDIDTRFLAALEHGLPPASGIALGFDRLIMLALKQQKIRDVMAFTQENA